MTENNQGINDIGPTLAAKSDQLNAADLMGGPAIVTITDVKVNASDQPVSVHLAGDRQPYKPCLSMRRVLARIYGESSKAWIGHSLTLYCDSEVTWGGKAVGGIRISHATGVDSHIDVLIRKNRKVVETARIYELIIELPAYPDKSIDENLGGWAALFAEKKATPTALIAKMRVQYQITDEQEKRIIAADVQGGE